MGKKYTGADKTRNQFFLKTSMKRYREEGKKKHKEQKNEFGAKNNAPDLKAVKFAGHRRRHGYYFANIRKYHASGVEVCRCSRRQTEKITAR